MCPKSTGPSNLGWKEYVIKLFFYEPVSLNIIYRASLQKNLQKNYIGYINVFLDAAVCQRRGGTVGTMCRGAKAIESIIIYWSNLSHRKVAICSTKAFGPLEYA